RPISFKMDLYNPLYVSRPTVEPELFASLRPPTYSGAMNRFGDQFARKEMESLQAPTDGAEAKLAAKPRAPMAKADPRSGVAFGGGGFGGGKGEADRAAYAREVAEKLKKDMQLGASVQSVATASSLGDYFQYVIDRPVDLARQKSALLPIVNK